MNDRIFWISVAILINVVHTGGYGPTEKPEPTRDPRLKVTTPYSFRRRVVTTEAPPPLPGTCFARRTSSGACLDIMPTGDDQDKCCKLGGYFTPRILLMDEVAQDHLVTRTGSTPCNNACDKSPHVDCQSVKCDVNQRCVMNEYDQPVCKCSVICVGLNPREPVCTSDNKRYYNRCIFLKHKCRAPANSSFFEIPCQESVTIPRCYPLSVYRGEGKQPLGKEPKPWEEEYLPKQSLELMCPTGQYCLIRQFDARPACQSWPEKGQECQDQSFVGPVCGIDNKTYRDPCELIVASIKSHIEIVVAYKGPCRYNASCDNIECMEANMTCKPHGKTSQPVCISCEQFWTKNCGPLWIGPDRAYELRSSLWNSSHQHKFGLPNWNELSDTIGWPSACQANGYEKTNACRLHEWNCLGTNYWPLMQDDFCQNPDNRLSIPALPVLVAV